MQRRIGFTIATLTVLLSLAATAQENDGVDIEVPAGDQIVETVAYDDEYIDPVYGGSYR